MSKAQQLLQQDPASQMLGIQLINIETEFCQVEMNVLETMTNGYDICHGGFVFTLADTASAFASAIEGKNVLSASNQIEYLMAAKKGDKLTASARVNLKTGRYIFCDVQVHNQNKDLVALLKSKLVIQLVR